MKNKNAAAFLAIILGYFGVHRFYLGQVALGIFYILGTMGLWFFNFKIIFFIAIIDAIKFLTMSEEKFDKKYNQGKQKNQNQEVQKTPKSTQRRASGWEQMERSWNVDTDTLGYKKEGIAKYKNYDFKGAIEQFNKAIDAQPKDAPTYFNLACCYSMTEDKAQAFNYLSKSVALGMKDFQKILTHDGLAYLRIQPEWDNFVANDYQYHPDMAIIENPSIPTQEPQPIEENSVNTTQNPLDALRNLYEKRQKGLIDEQQFEVESKKLLQH